MLDADDDSSAALLLLLLLCAAADEVVAYACEVARAGADVEHAWGGTVEQVREEKLGCVCVLFLQFVVRVRVRKVVVGLLELRGGERYVPCVGQRWLRRDRSIFTVQYSTAQNKDPAIAGCVRETH